jgi:16S rRNA C967 or C1407 C5-methylase (RsmB/RsmF family)
VYCIPKDFDGTSLKPVENRSVVSKVVGESSHLNCPWKGNSSGTRMKGQRTQVRSLVRCVHLASDGVFKVMMNIVILD